MKNKYNDIGRSRSTGRNLIPLQANGQFNSENYLKSAQSWLKVLKNDKSFLEKRHSLSPQADEYLEMLQLHIKEQLQTVLNLEKENKRLNKSQSISASNDKISLSTDGSMIREIVRYRKNINKAEEQEISNQNKMKEYQIRILKLEEEIKSLKTNGNNINEETESKGSFVETYKSLAKKLKLIMAIWKINTGKLQQKINDLEKEQKELQEEAMALQTRTFKKQSQQRLLKMTFDDYSTLKLNKYSPKDSDFRDPDVSFFYKPSINALYT
ncbi:unnamed protein product [Blepharisma stoltei]|uniref:Uncharacterized protein n=1 Tax=Blepharisma stoltei TaxID=1481888 RepID=A0AAU9IUN4_9CILI|nr:unnamed protein product [Blepharisma stoltei]